MTRPPDPTRPYDVAAPLRGTETIKARCGDVRPGSGDWLQLVDVDPVDMGADPDGGGLVVNLHPSMLAGPIIVRRTVPRERKPDPTVEDLTAGFTQQVQVYRDYADAIPRADPDADPLPDPLTDEALAAAAAGITAAGYANEGGLIRVGGVHVPPTRPAALPSYPALAGGPGRRYLRHLPGPEQLGAGHVLELVAAHGVMLVPGGLRPIGPTATTTMLQVAVPDMFPGLDVGDPVIVWTEGDAVPTVLLDVRTWEDVERVRKELAA